MKYRSFLVFCCGFFVGCSVSSPNLEGLDTLTTSSISQTFSGKSGIEENIKDHNMLSHPRLQSARQEILSAYGRRIQETLWANPRIESVLENVAGDKGGVNGSEWTISLSQEIPVNGVLTLKEKAVQKEEEEAECRYKEELFAFISEIYLAYHQTILEENREKSLASLVDIATNFAQKIKDSYESGKMPKSDFLKAEVSRIDAGIKLSQAETNKSIARQKLASLLLCDVAKVPVLKENADLPDIVAPSLACVQEMLKESPALKKLEAAHNRLSLQKSRLQREVWPNPEVTIGGRRDYAENQNSLVLGLGLSLPVWNRNQGSIYEVDALLEKSLQEQKNAKMELERELFAAHKKAVSSRESLENYRTKAIPAVDESFQLTKKGYEEGKLSILEVILAQQTQLETQLEYWQEAENFYTAIASIYKLVGPWKTGK